LPLDAAPPSDLGPEEEPPRKGEPPLEGEPPLSGGSEHDASVPGSSVPDAGEAGVPGSSEPDAGAPPEPEPCAEHGSRTSDRVCLDDGVTCFSLGSVLSPSLTAWLDPTTLPTDGSGLWCDRSGQGHHGRLLPDAASIAISEDGRPVSDDLARSLEINDSWLELSRAGEPVLAPGNFAVVIAAATPLEATDPGAFELFESGEGSRINLSVSPDTGTATGRITSDQTELVTAPVVTRSRVNDGRFHLLSLYRRSEVRVLDDVLQLRLNGVLEFRASSIAIPRALDLVSTAPPLVGRSRAAGAAAVPGRGRVAAVVILQGSVPEDELARLETFLCEALAVCQAPEAPPGGVPPPDPVVPRR
jgi:hypothetical protein